MINDEQLLLYYYSDGLTDDERQQIRTAIDQDEMLAARYRALAKELDGLRLPTMESPTDEHKAQWHSLIEDAASESSEEQVPRRSPRPWVWSAALAASLLLGISLGSKLGEPPATEPIAATPDTAAETADSGVFERGLESHMLTAESQLVAFSSLPQSEQSELIKTLVSQNRLFAKAAEETGAADLARLLRAFEPILLRLNETEKGPTDAEALRSQLGFEIRSLLTQLKRPSSNKA